MITTVNLEFSVSGQTLKAQQEIPYLLASNTVKYVKAHFELGEDWQSVETVSAVWSGVGGCYSMVLDDGGNCFVPQELLAREQRIYVNLVGSDVDNDEVVDRITTYPVNAIKVNATAYTCGSETVPLTPSQFEQYVAIVSDLVHSVKDIDRIELNEDYTLTVYYSDGTSYTTGSIRGEAGPEGPEGPAGPQGEPGEVTLAQLEQVLPTDTASGAIATFPDGISLFDAKSVVIDINPVQSGSGDPSPNNVRPITGWNSVDVVGCGKNVSTISTKSDVGWADTSVDFLVLLNSLPVGTYTISFTNTLTNVTGVGEWRHGFYANGAQALDGRVAVMTSPVQGTAYSYKSTFTITEAGKGKFTVAYLYGCGIGGTGAMGRGNFTDIQIEVGSSATPYEPYNGTTYPVSWQTEAGTVYGGTVDLVSGGLTDNMGNVSLDGSSTPAFNSVSQDTTADGTKYVAFINSSAFSIAGAQAISDKYKWVDAPLSSLHVGEFNTRGSYIRFVLADQSLDTLAKLNADLANNPIKLVYTKKTADEYTIDSTTISCLLGQNNVWADCGNVEVQYKADVQGWVEKKLGQV